MDFETRVRIFLTKYKELVREMGLAIGYNMYDDSSKLILRINSELKNPHEIVPSYLNFYGDDPNLYNGRLDDFFVIMYNEDGSMKQLDAYNDMPEFIK